MMVGLGRRRAPYGCRYRTLPVANHTTELRRRAEACRSLAEASDAAERKALWRGRRAYWEEYTLKAVERILESISRKPQSHVLLLLLLRGAFL